MVDTVIEEGDAFYPEIPDNFELTEESEPFTDENSGLSYKFVTYMHKKD